MQRLRLIYFLPMLLCLQAFAQSVSSTRYQDFDFSPEYPDQSASDSAKSFLSNSLDLLPWHTLPKVDALALDNGNTWSVYSVEIAPENLDAYGRYKDKVEITDNRRLEANERREWKDVSFFNAEGEIERVNYKRAERDPSEPWSSGVFWGSSFGCIDEQPLFLVDLIEGHSPSVVLVTAMRDGIGVNYTGESFIRLSIFNGETGELQAEEYPLLRSVIANKRNKKTVSHSMRSHYSFWEKWYGINWNISSETEIVNVDKTVRQMEEEMHLWKNNNWNLAAARYQYTKLFAGDYDNDGLLELIFWHKRYRANDRDKAPEFFLEKEYFTVYTENSSGTGFVKSTVDASAGIALLESKNHTWNEGWPQDNALCGEKQRADTRSTKGLTLDSLE